MGALGLLLVLHTQQLTGSYAKGGLGGGRLRHRPGRLEPGPGARRRPPRPDARPAGRRAARGRRDRRARRAARRRAARRDPRRRGRRRRLPAAGRRLHARAVAGAARHARPPPRRLLDGGRAARGRLHLRARPHRGRHRLLVARAARWRLRRLPARRRPRVRRAADLARVAPARPSAGATSPARCAAAACACSSRSSCSAACRSARSRCACPPRWTRPATAS